MVAKDEVDSDSLIPVWGARGQITLKRGATKVPEPANAEELRKRLSIFKNAMILISLKYTNRPEVQGSWDKVVEEYKDYLLGDYVWNLVAKDEEQNTIATPP